MKSYRIYKPNKNGNGAASEWQLAKKKTDNKYEPVKVMMFLVGTKQTGFKEEDASFGWDDKASSITFKLGVTDIGELLAVLNGIKDQAGTDKGMYHQNDHGSTVLSFSKYVKDGNFIGYGMRLSRKNKGDAEATQIQHLVSVAEGEVLRILFAQAIQEMYGWSKDTQDATAQS